MGYRKIRAKVCTWGVAEKDDKDRKGEVHAGKMGPLTNKKHTTGHLLLPIPVALQGPYLTQLCHPYPIFNMEKPGCDVGWAANGRG